MLVAIVCTIFVLAYLAIAFEHNLHINKAAPALFAGVVCWTIYVLNAGTFVSEDKVPEWFRVQHETEATSDEHNVDLSREFAIEGQLTENLAEIAGVLFFLLGAMTIVEMVDAFEGFSVITDRIRSNNKLQLLWVISFLSFFMSAVLDNLTTTIVMISLVRKLVEDHKTRLFFAGMIVCAANAGGAWTVIGDVTTTMLWIKEKISVTEVAVRLFVPSLICFLVPLIVVSLFMRGKVERPVEESDEQRIDLAPFWKNLLFAIGVVGLLSVPIFKLVTHLPPFMGMLLSLSVLWIVAEIIRRDLDTVTKSSTHVVEILKRIDTSSILFFLGILLAVGSLASMGILTGLAEKLDQTVGNLDLIALIIGLLSSVVDNVPLVAAGIEMYGFPKDHGFWQFLAYTAGTGGSCLIIGSAAGVAAMGLEKINFMWYLRNITPLALLGFFSGAAAYYVIEHIIFPSY
ncbi:MAG: sodium:proton antiporter NhaD [Pirellulaceae bacterium]